MNIWARHAIHALNTCGFSETKRDFNKIGISQTTGYCEEESSKDIWVVILWVTYIVSSGLEP